MSSKIVLVHSLFIKKDPIEQNIMASYFPLGLLYIASSLIKEGYDVEFFDCAFREDYREFEEFMKKYKPEIVGIQALMTVRRNSLILASIAKKYGAKVILGGPDPSAIPKRYLFYKQEDLFPVDIVVYSEGEKTIVELLNYFYKRGDYPDNLREIKGIFLREDGKVLFTGERELIMNLDEIPFPARELVDFEPYEKAWKKKHGFWSLSIINSRGCPYGCKWCQKSVFGRKFRIRSPENSAEEMKLIKEKYNPDQLRVVDDITGIRRDFIFKWRDEILKRKACIPFECLSRVDLVDEKMLKALKDIKIKKIYFGAESGSQKVLNSMAKGTKVKDIYRASEFCKKLGIKTHFFMMVGYPGEEFEDIKLSVKLLRETLPDEFSVTIAYPLPGTKFYESVRDRLYFDENNYLMDWDYTAENRLLFKREKYNTTFYRWVIRLLYREWNDEKNKEKITFKFLKNKIELFVCRIIVNLLNLLLSKFPLLNKIKFLPATGR